MQGFVSSTADIRGDYRYSLTRVWHLTLPVITFVLLNPSTADEAQLDPTLRRCVDFAIREGNGGMVILRHHKGGASPASALCAFCTAADLLGAVKVAPNVANNCCQSAQFLNPTSPLKDLQAMRVQWGMRTSCGRNVGPGNYPSVRITASATSFRS